MPPIVGESTGREEEKPTFTEQTEQEDPARRMERKGPGTEGQGEGPVYCGAGTNQTTGDHKWKARPL